MASKISALTTLAAADLDAAADFITVVDTSATATKKITPAALLTNRTFTGTLTWDGLTGTNLIAVPDNLANALAIKEGSNTYLQVVTTNGSEALSVPQKLTVTSGNASALCVGANGGTNPAFCVDASASSAATGVKVTAAAAAGGAALAVVSSGTNENLTIDAKGSGTVTVNGTATGGITLARAVTASSSLLSTSASGGVGYGTGAGGAVTQATSRTTGVTVNAASGAITLVSAAGSTTFASFTVTNSAVAATDTVVVSQKSGTDLYEIHVTAVAAGSFRVTFRTTGGTTTEQPTFNFAVFKAVAA